MQDAFPMRISRQLQITPPIPEGKNWRVTCATICRTPGGDLLCAWYGGPSLPETGSLDPRGLVYLSRLAGGADAWSEPEALGDAPDGAVIKDPVLFEYPAGTLTAVRTFETHSKWGNREGDLYFIHFNRSTDDGHTWSERVPLVGIGSAATKNKPFVEDSTCVLPMSLVLAEVESADSSCPEKVIAFRDIAVVVSTDNGVNWRQTALLRTADGTRLTEPTTVKLSDGSLLMYMRSGSPLGEKGWPAGKPGRIWQSVSQDGGFTWTEPTRTQLPNNNSGFDMCRTSDGRMFLAYNNHSRLGADTQSLLNNRYPLVLAESTDDGRTWRDLMTLDPGPGFEVSYASIISDPGDTLHCVYTWDRKAIKYICIDTSQIKEVTDGNRAQDG